MLDAARATALATVVLAIGAIVTAMLAGLAFRAQSQQVKLLGSQLDDQKELTSYQGKAIELQSQQLEVNRQQLDQQQQDLLRRTLLLERAQADVIDFEAWPSENLPGQPPYCLTLLWNNSKRPIRHVRCRIDFQDTGEQHLMTWIGSRIEADYESPRLGTWYRPKYFNAPLVMRRDSVFGFEYDLGGDHDRHWTTTARFTDDAGLHWQIDHELHLQRLDGAPDW